MFFGFRWSSVTGSNEFLMSSQCVVGSEFLLRSLQQLMGFMLVLCGDKKEKRAKWSVQENGKCSDIKAESERNSFWMELFFSKNLVSTEYGAAVNKGLCWLCWRRNQKCFDLWYKVKIDEVSV